jgi:hypothetical protein
MEEKTMSRMLLSQEAHIVPIIFPQGSAAPTLNSDVFSMKDASHASIILTIGAVGGAASFTVVAGSDFTPSAEVAIGYRQAEELSSGGDTLGALASVASTGTITANTANITYVIEVDAEDLPEGYPNLQVKLADLDNTTYVSAVAILTGLAYAGDANRTQIA